jgi:tyrosine decarboxylase
MLTFLTEEHIHWRRNFHPEDKEIITVRDQHEKDFQNVVEKMRETLLELSSMLKTESMPWFSPRYQGHMVSDTLMVANLAYMATMLYNPNNVAYEGSPATTELEIQVGKQFAILFGYNPETAWGHITADGTIANYEGLWVARNIKSVPLAVEQVCPHLVEDLDEWQLLNVPVQKILHLLDQVKKSDLQKVLNHSVRGKGMQFNLGKVLVPQTKHYSWPKAANVLGIGQTNVLDITVKDNYRMDIDDLRETIQCLTDENTPILAVIAVAGTTEEGAVDEVHNIVELRSACEKQSISFYLHADAAYGGYARCAFLDEFHQFMPLEQLGEMLVERCITETCPLDWEKNADWTSKEVYNAYKALSETDSITIDPHKWAYVPYAAGGIVFKDKRVLTLINYAASYVFKPDDPVVLGSFIMEGSKPGASAAAVWAAHQVVPLTMNGYGELISQSIYGANRFYTSLCESGRFDVDGRHFTVSPLTKPDLNIVDFAFNETKNKDLEKMNNLNKQIYRHCSYKKGKPISSKDFITSEISLDRDHYGDAPKSFLRKNGILDTEWERVETVHLLRSCVMTPYLTSIDAYKEYWETFMDTMHEALTLAVEDILFWEACEALPASKAECIQKRFKA